jgi:PAS domain S-box-containing protein/putative nucleotidyltransferase with HDIG domain
MERQGGSEMERQGDDGIRDKFRNPKPALSPVEVSAIRNRTTILNVDDHEASRYAVSRALRQAGFDVMEAANGAETLRLVKENPDLVILDVNLPDMSGFEVCRRIKADPATSLMPVLMLSATYLDSQSMVTGLDHGADGYLTEPVESLVLIATVKALLRIRQAEVELQVAAREWRATFDAISDAVSLLDLQGNILRCNQAMTDLLGKPFNEITGRTCWELVHGTSEPIAGCPIVRMRETHRRETLVLPMVERWLEVSVDPLLDEAGNLIGAVHIMSDITERVRAEEELQQSYVNLRRALEGTVHTLVSAIEMRDPYTGSHQRRVTQLARAIANEMGLPEEQTEGLRMAGLIHDLGKITVPAEILSKPSQLTELEFGLIKMHPQVGYDVLKEMDFPWPVAQIVLQHHERMDGSGYPQCLSGEEIILEARILGVADVVEAMASHRPYRPPRGIDKALEEISQNKGILYDSEVVDACLKLFAEDGFEFE